MPRTVTITVNGARRTREIEPQLLLVEFLRETLGLFEGHRPLSQEGRDRA